MTKTLRLLAAASILLAPAAFAANHQMQDAVRDDHGNVVVNTHGNCVVTKWESSKGGCARGMRDVTHLSREERTVYFDFNKSTLNAKEKAKLDELARIIKASKQVASVDIVGHADKIGKASYNQKLSDRRAANVKSFLSGKGLKTHKVRVEGVGDSQSVTSCDESKGRHAMIACLAEDRRVEIELNLVK